MGMNLNSARIFLESRIGEAMAGNIDACFDLGVAYSSGSDGFDIDLVQAHKWFNLAAMTGDERAQECRHDVAEEMTAREIIEAQKQARAIIAMNTRAAA